MFFSFIVSGRLFREKWPALFTSNITLSLREKTDINSNLSLHLSSFLPFLKDQIVLEKPFNRTWFQKKPSITTIHIQIKQTSAPTIQRTTDNIYLPHKKIQSYINVAFYTYYVPLCNILQIISFFLVWSLMKIIYFCSRNTIQKQKP